MPGKQSGFTLTEILIVVGLIVLLLALAVPALNLISGSRSVEGAHNMIAAFLARARAEAIGLQEVRGVFFFQEHATGRVQMAIVRETARPESGSPFTNPAGFVPVVDVFLDITPESEFVALPRGVGAQFIADARFNVAGQRLDDGYFGFNTRNRGNGAALDTVTPFGGVILFDGSGRLVSRYYAFKTYIGAPSQATKMGDLLLRPSGAVNPITAPVYDVVPLVVAAGNFLNPPRSQLGIALFDYAEFRGRPQNPNAGAFPMETDPKVHTSHNDYNLGREYDEYNQELWLDQNALILLVNRYNGTLVRGE